MKNLGRNKLLDEQFQRAIDLDDYKDKYRMAFKPEIKKKAIKKEKCLLRREKKGYENGYKKEYQGFLKAGD